ncbi:MAG: hypothetical protein M0R02_01580 [Bacteroidales bacterium]|nr:hypothetical protein [Bacteroidales bacterium]
MSKYYDILFFDRIMIHVYFHNSNVPEKSYVCKVILSEILGQTYTIHAAEQYSDYMFEFENGAKITFRDSFFSLYPEPYAYLCKQALPKLPLFYTDSQCPDKIPVLYGKPTVTQQSETSIKCDIDIIAAAFFMLSRWEESVLNTYDSEGRFLAKESYAYMYDLLKKPIVHIYAEFFRVLAQRMQVKIPIVHTFKKTITHDIDYFLKWNSPLDAIKTCVGDIVKRKSLKQCFHTIACFACKKDPYDTYSKLLDLSEKHGCISRFYLLFSKKNKQQFTSKYAQTVFSNIIKKGHELGVHYNHYTLDAINEMKRDTEYFEHVLQQKAVFSRQHFLRFQYPETFQALAICGIQQDSSLYYREILGFRTGMCIQHSVFDIHLRTVLTIQELPLLCMDVTLRNYPTVTQAEYELHELLHTTKQYQGNFVCLWHNSSFDEFEWKQYEYLYTKILSFS